MIPVTSLDDPRLAPYRNLRDRTLRGESIFITEGREVTMRLLASRFEAESIFVAEEFAEEFERLAAGRVPVYVAKAELLPEVAGFNFHRGVMAVGHRAEPVAFEALMEQLADRPRLRFVVCPEITKPENMGLIFRSAGAFGFDGFLTGSRSCDAFSRRCLRVSMGGVFRVPFVKTPDLETALQDLKSRNGVELVATVLDPAAEPLPAFRWADRSAVVLGNEFDGLQDPFLSLCDRRATIPIHAGVDSLNLGVAAGVFLYEMTNDRGNDQSPITND